jgi:hypothetical protein
MTYRIAVIPGDGIGPEVAHAGVRVLERLGLPLQFEWFDFGAERYLRDGTALPADFMDALRRDFAAIYFGAVGDPRVPGNEHAKGILLAMRFDLDLYINLRPCLLLDDRLSPLKGKGRGELRFTVFRENTEGLYAGIGGVFKKGTPDEVAQEVEVARASSASARRPSPSQSRAACVESAWPTRPTCWSSATASGGASSPRWPRGIPGSKRRPCTSTRWRWTSSASPRLTRSSSPTTCSGTS